MVLPCIAQIVEQIPNLLAMDRVEAGRGLVQKKQRRIVDERAIEREQLPHSAGQTSGRRLAFWLEIGQTEQTRDAFIQLRAGHPAGAAKKAKVLFDRQIGIKTEALRDVTEFRPHKMSIFPDVEAGDRGAAAGRAGQSAKHPHGRGLARAVRAEETENGAGIDCK